MDAWHREKVAELEGALHAAIRRQLRGEVAQKNPARTTAKPRRRTIGTWQPMSFNAAMSQAVLDGRKTQTRRPLKPQPASVEAGVPRDERRQIITCPLAAPRGGLWVREPVCRIGERFAYAADGARGCNGASYMPRRACRTWLRVSAVTCERLQQITPADARQEGMPELLIDDPIQWFATLWDGIYDGPLAWSANPWVWCVRFAPTTAPSD